MNPFRKIKHLILQSRQPGPSVLETPKPQGKMGGKKVEDLTTRLDRALDMATLKKEDKMGPFKIWIKKSAKDRIKEGQDELRQLANEAGANVASFDKNLKQRTGLKSNEAQDLRNLLDLPLKWKKQKAIEAIKNKLAQAPTHLQLSTQETERLDFLHKHSLLLGKATQTSLDVMFSEREEEGVLSDFNIEQSILGKLTALDELNADLTQSLSNQQIFGMAIQASRLTITELQTKFNIDSMPVGLTPEQEKQYTQNLVKVLSQIKGEGPTLTPKTIIPGSQGVAPQIAQSINPTMVTAGKLLKAWQAKLQQQSQAAALKIDAWKKDQSALNRLDTTDPVLFGYLNEATSQGEPNLTKPLKPAQTVKMALEALSLSPKEFQAKFDIANMPKSLKKNEQIAYAQNLSAILLRITQFKEAPGRFQKQIGDTPNVQLSVANQEILKEKVETHFIAAKKFNTQCAGRLAELMMSTS